MDYIKQFECFIHTSEYQNLNIGDKIMYCALLLLAKNNPGKANTVEATDEEVMEKCIYISKHLSIEKALSDFMHEQLS